MARRGVSMLVLVTVAVMVLVVGTAVLVAVTSLSSTTKSIDELWLALADSTGEQAVRRTLEVLQPVAPHAELTNTLFDLGGLSPERPEELLDYLADSLEAYPNVTWLSWGAADGTYLAAVRWPTDDGRVEIRRTWRRLIKPTDHPDPNAPGLAHWRSWARGADGKWTLVEETRDRAYDPRVRPWYLDALRADGSSGVWIDPYVMLSRRQAGIGYALACRDRAGQIRGVMAAEFEAATLSHFLSNLELGETGRVYLVDQHQQVIAHPHGKVLQRRGDDLTFFKASEYPDAMLRQAWSGLAEGKTSGQTVEVGDYLVMAKPFPKESRIPWTVVAAVPADEFFGDAHDAALDSGLMALLVALLALVLGLWLSRRLTVAVRGLESELNRIADFELDGADLADSPSFLREMNVMAVATDRMRHGLRSFAKYIPHQLVRQLLQSGRVARLGGEEREVTVLFSDIEGFTPVVEATPTDLVFEALGDYLGAMNEAIEGTDGTVCQYLGDAVMAFWGAPETYEDHAIRACRGALAMKAGAEALVASAVQRGQPALPTRFGVNSGEVIVGNIGAPNRFNYAILGDPVNTASRIEGLNKVYGTRLLIGERTAELVGDALVLRPIDWVRMRGKAEPVMVYELRGETADLTDADRELLDRYAEALKCYRNRDFDGARAGFEALTADPPSAVMARRCAAYLAEPPPQDWDGTMAMTTK